MAKNKCDVCGVEINLLQQQKLADGKYICRKTCRAKGFKELDYVNGNLPQVLAHHAQVELGTKLWNHYFVPRKKTKDKTQKLKEFPSRLYIAEDIGLMAFIYNKYKFFIFGKTTYACVYRIADLYEYEYENEVKKTSDGKNETNHYVHFFFRNVEGLYDFRLKFDNQSACGRAIDYFNKLFGIQKTVANIGQTWKSQVKAVKDVAAGVKSIATGSDDQEEKASAAIDSLDDMKYGDRKPWIAKADAALEAFKE